MVAVEPHLIARVSRRIIVWHVLASYLTAAILVGCEWQFRLRPSMEPRDFALAPILAPGAGVILIESSHPFNVVEGRFWRSLILWAILFLPACAADVNGILRRERAKRESAFGLCSRCGYDLRATPDRCPECGAIPHVYQEKDRMESRIMLGAILVAVAVMCGIVFSTRRMWPPGMSWQGYPRLSPFEAIQWHGQTPQVRVSGNWYKLLAINDVPIEQIIVVSQSRGLNSWQKHFNEDLVELLIRMGHDPGSRATLKVQDLSLGNVRVLKDVPMTEKNRDAIWQMGVQEAPEPRPSTAP